VTRGDVGRAQHVTRPLAIVTFVYAAFKTAEMGVWIAVTLFAHDAGGVGEASKVIVAELLPAALFATSIGAVVARVGARTALVVGLAAQSACLVLAAVFAAAGAPNVLVYVAAVGASVALVTTRPAVGALLPSLARDPRDLTRVSIALGRCDGAATLAGPAITAVTVGAFGVGGPFAIFAIVTAAGALAALLLPAPPAVTAIDGDAVRLRAAAREVWARRGPRATLALLAAHSFVVGCLDILVVVIAVDVLHQPNATAGWLAGAVGGGILLGGLASVRLVGDAQLRRTATTATAAVGVALALVAAAEHVATTALALVVVGFAMGVMLIATRALLQRLTELRLLAHVFAFAEASEMTMFLVAAVAVPAFVALLSDQHAVLGPAVILVAVAVVTAPALIAADALARPALDRIGRLRAAELFDHLPLAAMQTLALSATPRDYEPGEAIMRQGEPGDAFHVIVAGCAEIERDGEPVNECGPGAGVGELALLHDAPRAATVRAVTHVSTLAIERDAFLLALTSHPPPRLPTYS
jgi:MFS family permease